MADDWQKSTWGEEISLEYGKALRGHEQSKGQYRVFGSNGPIGWTNEPLASGPGVILGRKGAYRGVEYSPSPFFVIDTAYFVVSKRQHDMRWLFYAIKHHKLGEIDDGSPIPSTTRAAVYPRELEVPPISEQRAIAHILGTLDDKIELNRRMSETLEAMARALFKSWFVDFDPVHAKMEGRDSGVPSHLAAIFPDRLVKSERGEIPEGWVTMTAGTVADFLSGGTPRKSESQYWHGDIPWISPKSLNEIHVHDAEDRVTEEAIGNGTRLAPDRSILVMVRGMGLHQGLRIGQARRAVAFNQDVKALVPTGVDSTFLLFGLLTAESELFTKVRAAGHGTGVLETDSIREIKLNCPPREQASRLMGILNDLNERIAASQIEILTLVALRDTLLPKLVSGELRVKDADAFLKRVL